MNSNLIISYFKKYYYKVKYLGNHKQGILFFCFSQYFIKQKRIVRIGYEER